MLSSKRHIMITTITAFSSFALVSPAMAANVSFEQIFIFGNSRSDTGNIFSLSNNFFPPAPLYNEGRFSNDLVWVDYISQDLGLNPSTFYGGSFTNADDGINFAAGGATTGISSLATPGSPGIATQVDNFVSFLNGTEIDENSLITYWGGENDYAEGLFTQNTILDPAIPVNNISNSLEQLATSGAKNILVANLPNLGDIPLGVELGVSDILNVVTAQHNNLLKSEIDSLQAFFPETNFILFDANSFLKDIFNNPTTFGLNPNTLESCLTPNNFPDIDPNAVVCDNPDEFFFYDNQHYTGKIHGLIGNAAIETIDTGFPTGQQPQTPVPEPRNIVGLLALCTGLLFQSRKRKS